MPDDTDNTMGIGSTVFVVNKTTNPRTEMYAGRRYLLEPNERVPVPWEAMVLWYGDPRSSENISSLRDPITEAVTWVPDRDSEIRRLTARYGGDEAARFPEVEVLDLDGNNLHSVLEDPSGDHVMPAISTVDEAAEKDRKISTLESRLARLEGMLTGNPDVTGDRKDGEENDDTEIPEPDQTPSITGDIDADASAADVPDADDDTPGSGNQPGNQPKGGKGRSIR